MPDNTREDPAIEDIIHSSMDRDFERRPDPARLPEETDPTEMLPSVLSARMAECLRDYINSFADADTPDAITLLEASRKVLGEYDSHTRPQPTDLVEALKDVESCIENAIIYPADHREEAFNEGLEVAREIVAEALKEKPQ